MKSKPKIFAQKSLSNFIFNKKSKRPGKYERIEFVNNTFFFFKASMTLPLLSVQTCTLFSRQMAVILQNVYLKHAEWQLLSFLFYFRTFIWYKFQTENERRCQPWAALADNTPDAPELPATHLRNPLTSVDRGANKPCEKRARPSLLSPDVCTLQTAPQLGNRH